MNKNIKKIMVSTGLVICLLIVCFAIATADEDNAMIYTAKGKYWNYYHIKFTLTPDNTLLTLKDYYKYGPSKYEFADGGFQIFIPKNKFPILAPNCKGYIILRMPGTLDDIPHKEQYIAEKKTLFDRIKEMKESGKGQVDVVVQLNESDFGIKVISKNPLKVEVEGTNVFFRDSHGRYIDYVGDLK